MFSKPLLKTKLKATAVHMSLSIAVFVYLSYQIYYNWYPQPYFSIDGGWQGFRLIGAVDLVLGPLITFLIFDLRKSLRAIVFDLVIILVIQLGALAYGIYVTYTQRPVAIVMIDDYLVPAIMEHYAGTLESSTDLYRYSDERPPIIYTKLPQDRDGLDEVIRIKFEEQVLEHAQVDLYRSHKEMIGGLREQLPRMLEYLDLYGARSAYDKWLRDNEKSTNEVYIRRFDGRYGKAWLVFDLQGRYIGFFRKEV